jgi:hypothetical protein
MKRIKSRIIVELDDAASKMLREYLSGVSHPCLHDGEDPRDVVSAAVVFLMGDDDIDTQSALEHAKERRLALEGKEGQ